MAKDGFFVQDLARFCGLHPQTVRRYSKLGIIKPTRNEENGYRTYDMMDFPLLKRLRMLRNHGFEVTECCDIFRKDEEYAIGAYSALGQRIDDEIEELMQRRALAAMQEQWLREWQQISRVDFVIRQRPRSAFFPLHAPDAMMDDPEMFMLMQTLLDNAPPVRPCLHTGADALQSGELRYRGGMWVEEERLAALPQVFARGEIMEECTCMVIAVSGIGAGTYVAEGETESRKSREDAHVRKLLAQNGFALCGDVITEYHHLMQLSEDTGIPHQHNFRNNALIWVPVK